MARPRAAAELEQIEAADDVGLDVGARILEAVAHAGLGCEMHDAIGLLLAEQLLDERRVFRGGERAIGGLGLPGRRFISAGGAHEIDWRKELRAHLEKVQQPDGTWVNGKNGRWMEDSAFLCTCYALTTLELCR